MGTGSRRALQESPTGGRRLGPGKHRVSIGLVAEAVLVVRKKRPRDSAPTLPRTATRRQKAGARRLRRFDKTLRSNRVLVEVSSTGLVPPGSAAHTQLAAEAGRSPSRIWVLVFENLGCISRPDASWQSSSRKRKCPRGRPNSGGAEAPSTRCRGASRVNRRAKPVCLAWTTGRAGSSSVGKPPGFRHD
jgi:hypothetical protein